MYLIDPSVPKELLKIQTWVGKVLHTPCFALDRRHLPVLDEKTKEEASQYIEPSRTLRSDQRIAIYNQQYWWRLLKILRKDFSLLARLFGKKGFESKIALPYLQAYPPSHWSLYLLGKDLPLWVEANYPDTRDKKLVCDAARLDYGFSSVFFEKEYPSIQRIDLNQKIYLQPYLKLFTFEVDLCSFRREMISQEIDYWLEHDFPELSRSPTYCVIFRFHRKVRYLILERCAFDLLKSFEKGTNLQEALDRIEPFSGLDKWFQKCVQLKWLTYQH